MMLHYDPMPDCTREYVEDEGGSLLFCRDYDDETFHELCRKAKRLLVRIPEHSTNTIHPRIMQLAQAVQSIIIGNTKIPSARTSLNLPSRLDLALARRKVLDEAGRRLLVGYDMDDSGAFVLVLCFVPEAVCDCDLILDL